MIAQKREKLREMLRSDWKGIEWLCTELGWQPHTVRGAISTIAKDGCFRAERQRVNGKTSYRLVNREEGSVG